MVQCKDEGSGFRGFRALRLLRRSSGFSAWFGDGVPFKGFLQGFLYGFLEGFMALRGSQKATGSFTLQLESSGSLVLGLGVQGSQALALGLQ